MIDIAGSFVFAICSLILFAGIGKHYLMRSRISMVVLFLLKCICGCALLMYYARHGGGDMIEYIRESETLLTALKQQPDLILQIFHRTPPEILTHLQLWNNAHYIGVYSDNRIFLLYLSGIRLLTGGSVLAAIVITNFLALCGLIKLTEFSSWILSPSNRIFHFWTLLFPTILIWTSGLFKESVLIFPLGYLFLSLRMEGIKATAYFVICLLLTVLIKPYLVAVILPGLAAYLILKKNPNLSARKVFFFVYAGGLVDLLLIGIFIAALNLPDYLFGQQLNMMRNAVMSGATTVVGATHFAPTGISFLKHIPESIVYAFMRPFPYEKGWLWSILFGLESITVLCFAIYSLLRAKYKAFSREQWLLLYAGILLLMLLGFTIPVLGNLVRLRMPSVLFLILCLTGFKLGKEPSLNQN